MKKLITITSVLAFAAVSAMSQGYVNALNGSTVGVIKVSDPTINAGAASTVGSPANAAGFVGAGPGQITVEGFVEPNGTDLSTPASLNALLQTTPLLTATNSGNAVVAGAQGAIAFTVAQSGNPFVLPTGNAFNGSAPVEFVFYGITANGKYAGFSSVGTITPAASGTGAPAPGVFGSNPGQISSWVLTPVPEPTTLALGGLGAAALLLFRRRK